MILENKDFEKTNRTFEHIFKLMGIFRKNMNVKRGLNCSVIGCNTRKVAKHEGSTRSESDYRCNADDVGEQMQIKELFPRTFHA